MILKARFPHQINQLMINFELCFGFTHLSCTLHQQPYDSPGGTQFFTYFPASSPLSVGLHRRGAGLLRVHHLHQAEHPGVNQVRSGTQLIGEAGTHVNVGSGNHLGERSEKKFYEGLRTHLEVGSRTHLNV